MYIVISDIQEYNNAIDYLKNHGVVRFPTFFNISRQYPPGVEYALLYTQGAKSCSFSSVAYLEKCGYKRKHVPKPYMLPSDLFDF